MVYGDLQFFDIIVFAVIAVFLIYRLRGALGKRTGYQKAHTTNQYSTEKKTMTKKNIPQLKDNEQKLLKISQRIRTKVLANLERNLSSQIFLIS